MCESKRALFISDRVTAQHRCYRNSHTCVRDTTHSDVKWLIQMCDMTHSDVCHDSFKSVTWLCVWAMCEFHTCVRAIGLFSIKVLKHIGTLLYRDSFLHICVPWLIQICDVTMCVSKKALFISDRVTARNISYRNSHTCVRAIGLFSYEIEWRHKTFPIGTHTHVWEQ